MNPSLYILKIGGKVLENDVKLENSLKVFSKMEGAKILIHGGGKKASEFCQKMDIIPKMVEGRRITDAATLEVVAMVYAGLINKKIVSQLQSYDCDAIGLSGADGNVIQAIKRPVKTIDYGFAGDIKNINKQLIINILNQNLTLVFCSLTHDKKGQLLNTNADTIATSIATALVDNFEVQLQFQFEKKGVLKNPKDDDSYFKKIDADDYIIYKQTGIITDGMIPKLDNAFAAKAQGVKKVCIAETEII